MLLCRDRLHTALVDEMRRRDDASYPEWVDNERAKIAQAANRWAKSHNLPTISVNDVEALEGLALGHSDYAPKLALYVAELVCGYRQPSSAPQGAVPDGTRPTARALRAHEFEVPLGYGRVQVLAGHPRYCPQAKQHRSHHFSYEYLDRDGQIIRGAYSCNGSPAPWAADAQPLERHDDERDRERDESTLNGSMDQGDGMR